MMVAARTRGLGFVIALGLVAALAGAARAAGGASLDDEKRARALYESAEKSFDVGKFAEALTDYQAAYEAKPLPGFLFNIAQCYRNMGNYERARFFFRRYLALDPHAPNHRRVEELISEMTKQLDAQAAAAAAAPAATPTTPPPAPTPPIEPVAPSPTPSAAPGSEAAPAPSPAASAVPPLPAPEPETSPAATLTATAPEPSERRPVYKRWWFWTGVGAVVVGGAVAAFFLTRQPEATPPGTLQPIDGRGL
jgi:hypothetical protein